MGNCFGKPSDKNFSGEGRAVGAATATTPLKKGTTSKAPTTQGGRTLGASSQGDSSSSPRDAAAKAAEVRTTYRYTAEPDGHSDMTQRKHAPRSMVATAWM